MVIGCFGTFIHHSCSRRQLTFALQTVIMIILIPLPLFFASTVYGVGGFTAWVVIAMIWAFIASFIVVLYPLWESRVALTQVFKGVVKDIMQPGAGKYVAKPHTAA